MLLTILMMVALNPECSGKAVGCIGIMAPAGQMHLHCGEICLLSEAVLVLLKWL